MLKNHTRAAKPRAKHHTVTLKAPEAKSVAVTGNFCNWELEGHPLKHDGKGIWKATLTLLPGRYEYRLLVDGEWRDDPGCTEHVANPFGSENCVFQV
ncbi:MAG: glycogen-binding domain-containing protein [Planctomycetia bacterium]|nr:glycogen-binding domain-containing protein [Planctomycetia bacterium]